MKKCHFSFLSIFFVFFGFTACAQQITSLPSTQTVIHKQNFQANLKIPENITFAGEPIPLNDPDVRERLDREMLVSANRHSAMIYTLKKQNRWKKSIMDTLAAYGVPTDFFYLAVAESDLDVYAQSPKQAVGMWQFLEETAKEYKLEVSKHVDERRDPLLATAAAARYLKDAYKKFGSWSLVAASYNRGMAGTRKALDGQKVSSYYDLFLNTETSRYVPRITSLKIIMENPSEYGFCIEENDKYPAYKYDIIPITEPIESLPDFAKSKGTTYKMLKLLNPALEVNDYKFTLHKGKTYYFRIPKP